MGGVGVALETIAHRALLGAREVARLGRYPWYWRLRMALALEELREPAWQVAHREGAASGVSQEDLTYGETPLLTAYELLRELGAGSTDTVVDLGCGRGQVVNLAALAFGCQGLGLEVLPTLAERGRRVARRLGLATEFRCADFRQELPPGTLYFLQPTTLEDASWQKLCEQLQAAPPGARAVSLSLPLPGWQQLSKTQRAYSWGWCTTCVQVLTSPPSAIRQPPS